MSMKITIGVLLRLRLMDVSVVLYRDSQMVRPVLTETDIKSFNLQFF